MIHSEKLPYSYRGFREGEYLHRYFLPDKLKTVISPRDLLVVYWILRGFTTGTHPRKMMPSAFRDISTLSQDETIANALLQDALTIIYTEDKLPKVIPVEQLNEILADCRSYMRALTETELSDSETDQLIQLNESLKVLQLDVTQRVYDTWMTSQKTGDKCELVVRYSFEVRRDDPAFLELDHNILYSLEDHLYSITATTPDKDFDEIRQRDSKDWNENHYRDNRLFQIPHCWLFHCLEVFSAVPLRHLLKTGRVTASIEVVTSLDMQLMPGCLDGSNIHATI